MNSTIQTCKYSVKLTAAMAVIIISNGYLTMLMCYRFHPMRPSHRMPWYSGCTLPPRGYRAWNQGVITVMKPEISRNCSSLFQGEANNVEKERVVWNSSEFASFKDWAMSDDCERIRFEFLGNLYTTKEEVEFPLAFSMIIHDNPQQILRLLKVIYRPHNLYCLHYDQKASDIMKKITDNIARCLDNVLIPQTIVNVVWGCHTLMEAHLNCMRELYNARSPSYQWEYTISLCGKELPLRTNREIVHMLKRLNGTSGLRQWAPTEKFLQNRFTYKVAIGRDNKCHDTSTKLGPVPYNVEIRKSSTYFSLTHEFIHFLLTNKTALDLYDYMKGAFISEEHYFGTVYWMKGE